MSCPSCDCLFGYVQMQVPGFLTDRMKSECTLGADHPPQATVLLSQSHLQRPNHEAALKVTQPRTTGTYSQSLTLHQ